MTSGTSLRGTWAATLVSLAIALAGVAGASADARADALDLEKYDGQIVLLDFFASWCTPCRHSFPWMQDMQQRYRADGLVVIAVNLDNDMSSAARFLDEFPVDFRIVFDRDRQLARDYQITGMPSSLLIGRDGQIIERHAGFNVRLQDRYERSIAAALGLDGTSK